MKINFNLNLYEHIVWIERRHQYQSYSNWFRDAAPQAVEMERPGHGCHLVVYNQAGSGTAHSWLLAIREQFQATLCLGSEQRLKVMNSYRIQMLQKY